MDNPQDLKKAILAVLAEKGDYSTLLKHLDTDEKKEKEGKMYKLIEPISAFADLLTQNNEGAFMEKLTARMDGTTKEALDSLTKDISDLREELKEATSSLLDTTKSDLVAEHLSRYEQAESSLSEKMMQLAVEIVSNKADELLPGLYEGARLTEDEIEDIIEASALSVESQMSNIIGDYITEQGISVEQVTGFSDAVRKLLPTDKQVTWSEIVGKPDLSQGGTNTNIVRQLITEALASFSGGISDGDKGDITVSNSGATWTIDNDTIGQDELATTGTPDGSKFLRDDLQWTSIPGGGDMLAANNLSDVDNVATARTNLGLGSAAEADTTDFAAALGADDNYVTDAEKTKLSNLSGTNTGDQDLSSYLTSATAASTYEPLKGADDNFVTDAEKTKLSNLSGTNTGDQDLSSYELLANKVTSISGASTDTQYPSAKLVYDQLALKAALASPTFTGTVTTPAIVVSSETASTLASFDASKNVKSLATASYPSLAEIAYVKGVTSAIQTQINGKEPTKGSDDNYVTDAEKVVIGNTSGTNTGDEPDADTTTKGIVELAIGSEVTTGTDATRAITPDALAGSEPGKRTIAFFVSGSGSADTALTTGDNKIVVPVDTTINGMNLVAVKAYVSTVSSSGAPLFQVRRSRRSSNTARTIVDMLSTGVSIDASEFESADAASAVSINTSNDDVVTGDMLHIDCDTAGTGAKGAQILLTFQTP